jgi:hypothetical protein
VLRGLVPQDPGVSHTARQYRGVGWLAGRGEHGIADGVADRWHGIVGYPGERGDGQRMAGTEIQVRSGQDGQVADSERFGELDQNRQAGRQPTALLDPLQPGRGHADQPGEYRPAQAPALTQDLDPLTSPLPGKIIRHVIPLRGRRRGLFRAYELRCADAECRGLMRTRNYRQDMVGGSTSCLCEVSIHPSVAGPFSGDGG